MKEGRVDGDRVVLAATLLLAIVCLVMFVVVDLTLFRYGMLNATGQAFATIATLVGAAAMILGCFLAFAGRSRSLTTPGISGSGWALICFAIFIGAPAFGFELSGSGNSHGGAAAALFMLIAGAALLQAERNAREHNGTETA